MIDKNLNKYANRLVNAFLKNKIFAPLPTRYTKKLSVAQKLRKLCESKINKPIIGFKAAGTGIPVLKKLKEKEPFYATVYKHNVLNNKKSVKINKFTMDIELVVGYRQKKRGIKSLGDLCSDFGANVKFVVGPKKKYKNQSVKNLKTNISNK